VEVKRVGGAVESGVRCAWRGRRQRRSPCHQDSRGSLAVVEEKSGLALSHNGGE